MLRAIRLVIAILAILVIVDMAVVNRDYVSISFWPLPYTSDMPLFIIGAICLVVGAVLGGIATWLGAWRYRARANRDRRLLREMEARERARQRQEAAAETERQKQRRANLTLT